MVTLLAPQVNKLFLFLTASFAMCLMNCISVLIGAFLAYLIPQIVISIIVMSRFTGFGLILLYKAYMGKSGDEDEREEIEAELR